MFEYKYSWVQFREPRSIIFDILNAYKTDVDFTKILTKHDLTKTDQSMNNSLNSEILVQNHRQL